MNIEDTEEQYCQHCNGSREGLYDGSTCGYCKGSGMEKGPVEYEDEPPEYIGCNIYYEGEM